MRERTRLFRVCEKEHKPKYSREGFVQSNSRSCETLAYLPWNANKNAIILYSLKTKRKPDPLSYVSGINNHAF